MVYGTSDIIVIEQKDLTLKSTPFYVRFGKKEVFRTRDKLVSIKVNNENIIGLNMRLDENGDGYFSLDFSEEERISLIKRVFRNSQHKKSPNKNEDKIIYCKTNENLVNLKNENGLILPEFFESKTRINSRSLTDLNKIDSLETGENVEKNAFVKKKKPSNYLKKLKSLRSVHASEPSQNWDELKSPSLKKKDIKKSNSSPDEKSSKPIEFSKLRETELKSENFCFETFIYCLNKIQFEKYFFF